MKANIILRSSAILIAAGLVAASCGDDDGDSSEDTTAATAVEEASADTAATEDTAAEEPDAATADCAVGETDGNLAIYNWAEYIDQEELDAFAAEYDISVTMDTYDSNEAMQPIISAGNSGFDLIGPSDYMVTILTAAGSVQALNQAAIPNMANLLPEFTDLAYDPGNQYSAPYQWGTTGMALNTSVVGADYEPTWGLIFDPELAGEFSGQITLLNDPRETMGAALKYLGYSLNTTSEEELAEATDLVSAARDNLAAFDTDQADELLVSGETVIAHGYSGDMFVQFLDADDPSEYVYFVPKEGGARWVDTIAIPFDAPHPCSAHTFINWLLSGEHGAALSNWNYYSTPNAAALDLLDEDLVLFLTDPSLVVGGVESLEQFVDTGDFEINYSDAFIEAKG
ncbi:MAG: spermidine/putrescine ABC transporter substrate-binding protein [Acidimicrobiia bacterium]|nr:spermidine/putrescine ABC transporter substrate-binding protein [Acidimicrobiia bacterium]